MIHGHGDDTYQYKNIRYNFSSNVNPLGMNAGLVGHLQKSIGLSGRYPEPLAADLAKIIENKKELPAGSVLVTNGAVEAFYLVASLFPNGKSLIYTPAFAEYEDACFLHKHSMEFCDNANYPSEKEKDADVVWICNPNNPDGKVFDTEIIKKQIAQKPQTLYVVDEAYVEFLQEPVSLIKGASLLPNLVVVRSLTKRFSIPGLRLGYLVASVEFINKLKSLLMPWRINSLALGAGEYCFSENYSDDFDLSKLLEESQRIQKEINQMDGFEVLPSQTSFFLVKGRMKAVELKKYLAENAGILIRDASNFRGLTPFHFRISTQIPEVNNHLLKALKSWNC